MKKLLTLLCVVGSLGGCAALDQAQAEWEADAERWREATGLPYGVWYYVPVAPSGYGYVYEHGHGYGHTRTRRSEWWGAPYCCYGRR